MSDLPAGLRAVLGDPGVTDICLNGPSQGFLDRGRGMEPFAAGFENAESLKNWILDEMSRIGKSWDARHPFVDGVIDPGFRIHAVFPPLAQAGILLSLRRIQIQGGECQVQSQNTAQARWSQEAFSILRQAIVAGDPILISGATGSGKTTLASDLLGFVPNHERILALEDVPELRPQHPHFLSLIARPPNADGFGEVSLRTLLRQALRMRPDRIILGECRGGEVLDLLQAINTGHSGALATLHANSPRDALKRCELLCLLTAGGHIPLSAIRELLACGIRWIVQVERTPSRRIREIVRVEGREGDTILLRPILQSAQ